MRHNFFEKIYWGWYQVGTNFEYWLDMMRSDPETDLYFSVDLWIGLNVNLSYVMETS
jgi:hypothetical protein